MSNTYVSDIRNTLYRKLITKEYVTDKTGVKTLEIMNASFIADHPAIIGTVNEDYVERELAWYKSQSLNVNDIPGETPAIWKAVATEDGYINSNYGWCIWSDENHNQYTNVLDELKKNPDSRRANMIYTRPTMHSDYNRNGMSDFMCTNNVQYLIRNGELNALVYMRSNDAVFGYKNDWAWQKHVLDSLCKELNVPAGQIYWNVSSLHVYERHFNLLKDAVYRS
jgi:thymidylate synthase